MKKNLIIFINIFLLNLACNSKSNPKFYYSDIGNLHGNWKLNEIGLSEKKNTFFPIDTINYNFKKLSIDLDKMIFHLTSYPFKNFEPSFPISVISDTIFLLSGTTIENKLVMLKKNTILYKFSEDHKFLHLQNLDDNTTMIFSKY